MGPPNVTLATISGMRIFLADQGAVGFIAMAALFRAGPDPALPVEAEFVEEAGLAFGEDLSARHALAVFDTSKRRIWRGPFCLWVAPVSAT